MCATLTFQNTLIHQKMKETVGDPATGVGWGATNIKLILWQFFQGQGIRAPLFPAQPLDQLLVKLYKFDSNHQQWRWLSQELCIRNSVNMSPGICGSANGQNTPAIYTGVHIITKVNKCTQACRYNYSFLLVLQNQFSQNSGAWNKQIACQDFPNIHEVIVPAYGHNASNISLTGYM